MIKKMDTLTTGELEEILDIWLTANYDAHPFIPDSYWQENLAFVREQLPLAELYIYREQNKILGFLGVTDSYIAGIFVRSDYRKQGIGKKLLDTVKQTHDTLNLSVYEKNSNALTFYDKHGFQKSNESIDETGEREYHLIWKK
ncbi:hypothetical protein UAY_01245 [Enterococcus moraviensis ATCC BAA-383]|uniref:N-acetyltransferase domain-containing protein n=1 Tax=Enterococcus moraviensis ATCC BAA-383 TaxID=1158609 RepID=R2TNW3_9ENTE|nr:GNAT family N-acetyltransferase [Enterococcus moraviensis]EOI01837.1 hypothetical protein UAY_01245 [Enterococcus moraviensis ATCC BAA-383]EOT73628.1 hypothetical protein I586_00622 [Enterococcus moraviensis ATCC BAA-383]OJG69188.1 hypothetical protein RV09_GL000587 [Enterococcus moraviensis]